MNIKAIEKAYAIKSVKADRRKGKRFGRVRITKKVKRITSNIVSNTIFIVLIVGMIVGMMAVATTITGDGTEVQTLYGFSMKIVTTGSMADVILPGDVVIIHSQDSYKVGDIITFITTEDETEPYTHRIISYVGYEGAYLTKGDANNAPDEGFAYPESIIGKVIYIVPQAGVIIQMLQKIPGWVSIVSISLISASLIISLVVDFIRYKKSALTADEIIMEQNLQERRKHRKFYKRLKRALKVQFGKL